MVNDLVRDIQELKKQRNAILLAHNYQVQAVQEMADIRGDSFELAKAARKVDQRTIVFCGVYFMAESAYMLNPDKTVLIPDKTAGCDLADTITEEQLAALKARHPGVPVACYINSSAGIKALSDVCVTSANALRIIEKLPQDKVIFIPDKNLAHYVQRSTNKQIIRWPGSCYVHDELTVRQIKAAKEEHPGAPVLAHPECGPGVIDCADHVFSTSGMLRFAKAYTGPQSCMIICTERGMLFPLKQANARLRYVFPSDKLTCRTMKQITPAKVRQALVAMQHTVRVPDGTMRKARVALENMMDLGR